MKALTIHQPYASLIADGRKPYETRHWAPPAVLIGERVAIHAAKKWDDELRETAIEFGYDPDGQPGMPLGAVVATARLVAAHQLTGAVVDSDEHGWWASTCRTIGNDPMQRQMYGTLCIRADRYGDFHGGRWAWAFDKVDRFEHAVPAHGAQGFWNWER